MKEKDKNKQPRKCVSEAQKAAIRRNYAIRAAKDKERETGNKGRTSDGKVPQGRTLSTRDNFLPGNTGSVKKRPVVVIEANAKNDLAVVPLSSKPGKDRTRLKNYQQGQSYYKHYVETKDNEGNPIRVNGKFKENHSGMDVSKNDVKTIRNRVLNHSRPAPENRKKINEFRGKKNPRN